MMILKDASGKRGPESKGVPESFSSYNIEVEPEGMGEHGKRVEYARSLVVQA